MAMAQVRPKWRRISSRACRQTHNPIVEGQRKGALDLASALSRYAAGRPEETAPSLVVGLKPLAGRQGGKPARPGAANGRARVDDRHLAE